MYQDKIIGVRKRRPNHIIDVSVSTDCGGGGETVLVNPRGLEVLMKYFKAQKPSELIGKTFESEEFEPLNALKAFFGHNYPAEKGIGITNFMPKPKKYFPKKWTIFEVDSKNKHFKNLVIGPKEEEYRVVYLKGCDPGGPTSVIGAAYLREKSQEILMNYFEVSALEELVGKEFRVNVFTPEAAMYALIAKIVDPDLI